MATTQPKVAPKAPAPRGTASCSERSSGFIRKAKAFPRIKAELADEGYQAGRHKIAKLMRLERLRGIPKRRHRVTTKRDPKHRIAKNLLEQDFYTGRPNAVWVADITYISTQQGWLYLAVVIDLYSRRVVGWSMSQYMTRRLVVQ